MTPVSIVVMTPDKQTTESVHFLPYGAYVASCGRIEDQRYPERWSDLRRNVTCAECQAQMTDLGDLPPAVSTPPGKSGSS